MNRYYLAKRTACAALVLASVLSLPGQEKPAADPTKPAITDEVVELSPFVVKGDEDQGYSAKYSLAGTRIRTELKDVGSSISVITSKFLADTSSTNSTQLLVYAPNTEVVGQGGNFLGIGDSAYAGTVRYGGTRVRGLAEANDTRDFFLTDIPWDSYNTGRIDLQRGPNSILFGIGSPAGIINASINHASFKDTVHLENKLDNFGTVRFSGDFNKVLIDKVLAVRLSLLDDDTKYRQEPAFRHDQRAYGALRWDPALLNKGSMHTSFEASFEKGDISSNLPRNAPPNDYITPWFNTLQSLQASGLTIRQADGLKNSGSLFRLWQASDQVTQGGTILAYVQGQPGNFNYRENSLDGPYHGSGFLSGIGGLGNYINERGLRPGSSIAAWRNQIIADRSTFDSYNILLDGNTKGEFNRFDALNLAFRQSFWDDTLSYEIAYDKQKVHSGQHHFLGDAGYGISVDVLSTELGGVVGGTPNPAGGVFPEIPDPVNPNFGRPYVVGARGSSFDWATKEKSSLRFTGFYDLNLKKLLGDRSVTGRIFGDNRFTTLVSQFKDEQSSASGSDYSTNDDFVKLSNDGHVTYIFDYLTNTKLTGTSAANLHLPGLGDLPVVQANNSVALWNGTTKVWNSTQFHLDTNFDKPEDQRTYGSASKQRRTVNTGAFVWQGYWLDSVIVPMFALRKDFSFYNNGGTYNGTTFTEGAPSQKTVLAANSTDTDYFPFSDKYVYGPKGQTNAVTSRTYSVVTHLPNKMRGKLPGNLDVSLIYNQSENFQPKPGRVDIQNRPISDPSGRTKEYGVAISALRDHLRLKVVHYETHEDNADIGQTSNLSAFAAMEVWARSGASVHAGKQGQVGTGGATWQADTTYGVSSDGHIVTFKPYGPWASSLGVGQDVWLGKLPNEPFPPGTVRATYTQAEIDATWAKEKASIDAILNSPPPDSFIAATGIDRTAFFSSTGPGMFDYGGGTANAVITGSTVSKGTEFELIADPIPGLTVAINASHTEAKRTSIAQSYLDYLNARRPFFYGPAGDMRIWSSGWEDTTLDPYTNAGNGSMRVAFRSQVDAPISLFLASENTKVPELKPWAFNAIANYTFQSDGWLRGANIGGGYRWQDRNVIGYPITTDQFGNETYDVAHPYFGPNEAAIDGWIGYERKITRKIKWHIQLNARNVFANDKLIKSQANPDGTGAAYRIPEPRTFTITNSFDF